LKKKQQAGSTCSRFVAAGMSTFDIALRKEDPSFRELIGGLALWKMAAQAEDDVYPGEQQELLEKKGKGKTSVADLTEARNSFFCWT